MTKMKLSDGFEMNYEVIPGLLPLDTLFIHGNLASNAWWRPAIEVWKQQAKPSYEGRAILAEWRGCGDSSAPADESQLALDNLASDYCAFLEKLGVAKTCVVGHSTGGMIALMAMAEKPHLFDRAFLLDSVTTNGNNFSEESLSKFQRMSTNREFCAVVLGATIYKNDANSELFRKLVDDACRVSKHNWLGTPRAIANVNFNSNIKKVVSPVTVAQGEFDIVLPLEPARAMAEALPHGSFLELKNQGHCMNIENPAGFVAHVNKALYQR